MGVNKILDMSARTLATYQQALTVTSHNISNANNPNFSRQKVSFSTEKSEGLQNIGTGVKIDDIQRITNDLTDVQLRAYNTQYNMADKQNILLSQMEALISEPSDQGLNSLLNKFFNSWESLSVQPDSIPLRQNVLQATETMTNKFSSIYSGIDELKPGLMQDAKAQVSVINNYLTQIRDLNVQIRSSEINGNSPNDMLDKRDQVLSELSKLVNANVSFDKDNIASVSVGGVFAVDKNALNEVVLSGDITQLKVTTKDGGASLALTGGTLGALSQTYNTIIPDYLEQLDTIGYALYSKVNEIHSSGYSLEDPPVTGKKFFSSYDHGKLTIDKNILSEPKLIAISGDGATGNNDVALQLANLKTLKIDKNNTIADKYSSFVTTMSNTIKLQEQKTETYELVMKQLENQKSNYSGVSVDEEMVNILKYQRSYDAAAKLIKIADDMFQTMLNMV